MESSIQASQVCLLVIFAHPDDETTLSGSTMAMYAASGAAVQILSATRGEQGGLGTGGRKIRREDLAAVREEELRQVSRHYRLERSPLFLGYNDQELAVVNHEEGVRKILNVMFHVKPTAVITHGPKGLGGHPDHIALHFLVRDAFSHYKKSPTHAPRLLYAAASQDIIEAWDIDLDGPEASPNVVIEVGSYWETKIEALKLYASQEDAQDVAAQCEAMPLRREYFHQVEPIVDHGVVLQDLWS